MLLENKNSYMDTLKTEYFKHHAIAPNFPKLYHKSPKKVENVRLDLMGDAPKLCWDSDNSTNNLNKAWYYIVYAVKYNAPFIDQYDPTKIIYVGTENEYNIDVTGVCRHCGETYHITGEVWEYPVNCFNYEQDIEINKAD